MGNIALFFVFMVVTVLIPGPAALFTVTCAVQLGRSHFFLAPTAVSIGSFFLALATSCGLALVIAASPTLYVLVQALGAVILAFLGYRNWVSPAVSFAADSADNPASKANLRQTFVSGVLLSLTNPVLLAGLVATFPQCIDPSAPYLTQATVLVTLCTMVYFAGQMFYGFLALTARGYLLGHGLWGLLKKASAVLFLALCARHLRAPFLVKTGKPFCFKRCYDTEPFVFVFPYERTFSFLFAHCRHGSHAGTGGFVHDFLRLSVR